MTRLTLNFTLEELTRSEIALRRGLDNTPPPSVIRRLERTAQGLELIRAHLGCRMYVSSGYRSADVNAAVGGSSTSQHLRGEAADWVAPAFGTVRAVCKKIIEVGVDFDQLIYEGGANGWIHTSFVDSNPRRQALTAHFEGGHVRYTEGIA